MTKETFSFREGTVLEDMSSTEIAEIGFNITKNLDLCNAIGLIEDEIVQDSIMYTLEMAFYEAMSEEYGSTSVNEVRQSKSVQEIEQKLPEGMTAKDCHEVFIKYGFFLAYSVLLENGFAVPQEPDKIPEEIVTKMTDMGALTVTADDLTEMIQKETDTKIDIDDISHINTTVH